jgi:cobalt-zinc-cadmium efflux system membrane fusion protein
MTRSFSDSPRVGAVVFAAALVGVLPSCSKGSANGAEAAEGEAVPAGGAITLWTDSTELFMEHPALIVGAPDKFAVHLTDVTDFAPLRSGKITLRFQPRDGGEPLVVVQDTPRAPGIYGPSPEFRRPGVYDLTMIVESPQARDSVTVPALRVYASADDAPKEEVGAESGISFLKEQQWKTEGFRTAFATQGSLAVSFEASGEIIPAAGKMAQVAAPISGLIDPGGVAQSPSPGQQVRRGQVIALLTPTLGEGGASYAEARARLREAEEEHERAKRLFAAEAIPQRRVREAEIRLQAAREALAGLGGGALTAGGRIEIRAPIGGIVTARSITPGSRIDAGAPLFTIIDPSVVWLEVNVPAASAPLVGRGSGATFQLEGSPRTYRAQRVVSLGGVVDSLSRTVPVIYEVANSDGTIRVGANARVFVGTGRRVNGVVVPATAILDENGRAIAYVQTEGETFEKRELTVGGTEGGFAVVLSGIEDGERVVTGAPYQVRLASLSTAVPAHGHEH